MRASIVIAAHNEGQALWRTVASVAETCAGLDCEIVIADDASWDGSVAEVRRRFPQVRIVRHDERRGTSATKDIGARHARGDVLVFLDGHTKPEDGAIRRLVEDVEALQGEAVVTPAVAGLDVSRWKSIPGQIGHGYFLELERFDCGWLPLSDLKQVPHRGRTFYESPALIGCAVAVHRELYDDLRGFDPHMRSWGVEDLDFGLKSWLLGHPILHDPEAVVGHRFRRRFDNFEVPVEHLVANQLRMARKNFTEGVWREWVERCRRRHTGRLAEHPEGLWAAVWELFQERRPSVEHERSYLMARRVRDEFWYAERFGLLWPRLQGVGVAGRPEAVPLAMEASPSPPPPPPPPEIDPDPPCEDEEECCECACSTEPVRYFNGEVQFAAVDLSSDGYGRPWAHRRAYSNRLSFNGDVGNGYNWLVDQWPYLIEHEDGSIAVMRGVRKGVWFDPVNGTYVGRHGAKSTLTHDAANSRFVLALPGGEQWRFHDFTHVDAPGLFASHVARGGETTEVMSYAPAGRIEEIRRSVTVGSTTTTESFRYTHTGEDRIDSATLRRQVNAGAWTDIRRALYEYYGASESHGSEGDLKRVRTQLPAGTSWQDIDTSYYRYYTETEANGFVHGLKFVVGPQAYAKMVADSLDPLTAANALVAQYADFHFEYGSDQRVTSETVSSGSRTFGFAFTTSTHADDYNHWKRRTVETRPDGAERIVYTNHIGQVLVSELRDGADRWIECRRYDADAREILRANPSAVLDYDDSAADLDASLRASDGLIRVTDYYATTGGGAAKGYVQFHKIKRGSGGSEIKLREFEYASRSAGGVTVHPVSKETVYRNENGTGPIETTYSRTWHAGTVQVEELTTTLPAVPTSQNGSGVSATRRDHFDEHGFPTWHMDERGFITRRKYDLASGGMVQRIDDVDTSQTTDEPSGWTTPGGGGLHLVTDFEHDELGRTTQELGPVHTIDLGGSATSVRRASWTVHHDMTHEQWAGQGYATGTAPNYTYTLINPVSIVRRDSRGNVREEIQATRSSTSGRLQPTDSFPQTVYVRWTTHQFTDCCLVSSTRLYHDIPSSGTGSEGTNYDETRFGYQTMRWRNRTVSPGGTITFEVFDVRGQLIETWVGTDDTGATETDPTGGGASGNNMVLVASREYDGGTAGGDGNLTQETQHVDATETRVTAFVFDWRNRRIDTDGEIDFFERVSYDNLDNAVQTDRYDTTASGNLIAREETLFDDRDRVYRTIRYDVDPATGTVGNSLIDNFWFDAAGSEIKRLPAGSKLFTKTVYDSLGRPTHEYLGYDLDETSYADASSVTDDVILEQSETAYDAASNAIQATTRQRYHNAPDTQTGALQNPATNPKARVTYLAQWHDALGREIATADYGTNGGSAFSRPNTIPARSDTVLVTTTDYNDRGEAFKTIDPAGREDRTTFDDAGRRVKLIENYVDGDPDTGGADEDRTTRWTYTPDGQFATITAVNPDTGDQVTRYAYGTMLSDSDVARSDLLRAEIYPDSDDTGDPLGDGPDEVYDRIEHKYNRLGECKETQDQNETVHVFDRDKLGRETQDRVTTLGTGVDGAVRRIETAYEVRGLVETITCYDNATVGQGSIVNQVLSEYNDFGQPTTEYQSHSGAVNTSITPKVQYGYADGSDNTIRPSSLTYPDGRVVTFDYGTADGTGDAASRVEAIKDGTLALVQYAYLGQAAFVEADYTEPEIKFTLIDLAGNDDPDTGDIYSGLDRFGRTKDHRWYNYGASADADRFKYGYDRTGNHLWRENVVAASQNKDFDELYAYDGLSRLMDMQRGRLNAEKDAISSKTFAQDWSLDPTGNWAGFREDDDGDDTWDLEQDRTSNPVNEITDISETAGPSWVTPAYDRAGNMTTIPQPADPTGSFSGSYDAWHRLLKLVDDGTNDTVQENEYDGRRFRIVAKSYVGGSLDETRHLYYSAAWQVLEERVGTSTDPDRQFVWGFRYLDDLLSRDSATTGNNERLYALQDANWNTSAAADSGGDVQERYAYEAYGQPVFLAPTYASSLFSSLEWEVGFAGYRLDRVTKLYQVRYRVYHSKLGTWIHRDPVTIVGGRASLYAYVESNPTGLKDPMGLGPISRQPDDGTGMCAWFCTVRGERLEFPYRCTDRRGEDNALNEALADCTGLRPRPPRPRPEPRPPTCEEACHIRFRNCWLRATILYEFCAWAVGASGVGFIACTVAYLLEIDECRESLTDCLDDCRRRACIDQGPPFA